MKMFNFVLLYEILYQIEKIQIINLMDSCNTVLEKKLNFLTRKLILRFYGVLRGNFWGEIYQKKSSDIIMNLSEKLTIDTILNN